METAAIERGQGFGDVDVEFWLVARLSAADGRAQSERANSNLAAQ
jgi:hypothetical protein